MLVRWIKKYAKCRKEKSAACEQDGLPDTESLPFLFARYPGSLLRLYVSRRIFRCHFRLFPRLLLGDLSFMQLAPEIIEAFKIIHKNQILFV